MGDTIKSKFPMPKPTTQPNKPKSGGSCGMAGKHERSMAHVSKGMSLAKTLASKNK